MEEKPDVVVVFAFGAFLAKDIFHSPNYWMAEQAKTLALRYGIPIITQWDIAQFWEDNKGIQLFNVQKDIKKHISILQISEEAKKLALKYGWIKIAVIATPQHHRRCMRDLKKIGFSWRCWYFSNTTPAWGWYSSKSTQFWTRSPWRWWLREIPLRLMPWWLYKKITA
ncbi:hypothetical protein L6251_02695 [Candidatus Parcubacteria bacterium]|nr:hypothetical protein [Candidatus Parcubacteria bacterium]